MLLYVITKKNKVSNKLQIIINLSKNSPSQTYYIFTSNDPINKTINENFRLIENIYKILIIYSKTFILNSIILYHISKTISLPRSMILGSKYNNEYKCTLTPIIMS